MKYKKGFYISHISDCDLTSFRKMLGDERFNKLAKYESEDRDFNPYHNFDYPTQEKEDKNNQFIKVTDLEILGLLSYPTHHKLMNTFLNFLAKNIVFTFYIANTRKEKTTLEHIFTKYSPKYWLRQAFTWKHTTQGHNFWYNINIKWLKHLNK